MANTDRLPNAPSYEYIGENECGSLARGGSTIVLENLTDRKIERLIKKDDYWLTHFQLKTKTSKAQTTEKTTGK